jgi:hypothetical protein
MKKLIAVALLAVPFMFAQAPAADNIPAPTGKTTKKHAKKHSKKAAKTQTSTPAAPETK